MSDRMTLAEETYPGIGQLVNLAMERWHPDLWSKRVKVAVLMVDPPRNSDGLVTGPALKHAGAPCAGVCSVASETIRVLCGVDAVIRIASDIWPDLGEDGQLALLDHELEHLEIVDGQHRDERPKLGMVQHDYVLAGFRSVIKRHGPAALEVMSARAVREREPMLFDALDDPPAETIPMPRAAARSAT